MKFEPVKSTNIAAVGYDPETKEMHVKFHSGTQHAYADVDAATHAALMGAKSIGGHFHKNVRDKFKSRKVT